MTRASQPRLPDPEQHSLSEDQKLAWALWETEDLTDAELWFVKDITAQVEEGHRLSADHREKAEKILAKRGAS